MRGRLKDTMKTLQANRCRIRVGSICSGWGTAEMVSEAFRHFWRDIFPTLGVDAADKTSYHHIMIIAILYSGHIEPAHTCLICFRSLVPKVTTSFMCEKQPERQKLLTFRYRIKLCMEVPCGCPYEGHKFGCQKLPEPSVFLFSYY